MARIIEIEDMITVGALAEKLDIPVTKLIAELMKNGVIATVNEKVDIDTAQIIVGELGLDIELRRANAEQQTPALKRELHISERAVVRPPVVAVMGHVDHGKTSLLDAIRGTTVAKGEAGGITQHISAYQVDYSGRKITFLDTPGHEAFAALREHGAQLTDMAIIVVAADDGIKPQTLEAIRYARKAGVKMIVAMNKIDKEGANPDRVKQQLAEQQMLPEEWGGDTIIVPVSAKTKEGVDKLLDMVLLVADVEELKADTDVPAGGLVIESHMEQGRGPVAEVLVQEGTLQPQSYIVAGGTYAKIRTLTDPTGKTLEHAGPSTPAVITGFKDLPQFGDVFTAVRDEKEARTMAEKARIVHASGRLDMTSGELLRIISRKSIVNELNVIVKADVQGSLTSVLDSLKSIETEEVAVRVVGSGIGAVTENDVRMAAASNAIIYGFNIIMPVNIKQLIAREKVRVRIFKIIYELLDDVKAELSTMLSPEVSETVLGELEIKGIFKTGKNEIICGGEVLSGKLTVPSFVRVEHKKEAVGEAEATLLKRGPQDAREVVEGEMCGVSLKTSQRINVDIGDRLIFFTRELITRQL